MAVTTESPAPYTAALAINTVIHRYRERGMQAPFTADVLARAGISDSLIPRTLQALQTLELIGADGMPTQTLEELRVSSQANYKTRYAEWVRAVYAEVFRFVDPAQDDEVAVRDAFRSYHPVGQQPRMVALFLGLCAEAEITAKPPKSATESKALAPIKKIRPENSFFSRIAPSNQRQRSVSRASTQIAVGSNTGLPPALSGLLHSLPQTGSGWTKAQRNQFITTFGAVLDFVYPIVEGASKSSDTEDET